MERDRETGEHCELCEYCRAITGLGSDELPSGDDFAGGAVITSKAPLTGDGESRGLVLPNQRLRETLFVASGDFSDAELAPELDPEPELEPLLDRFLAEVLEVPSSLTISTSSASRTHLRRRVYRDHPSSPGRPSRH